VLNEKNGRALIEAGLDELRVSLDASTAKSYRAVRGKDYFGRILKNVRAFRALQRREGHERPRVSAWLTGLKETIAELPAFVKVAAEIGVKEVYLQRLVFFEEGAVGHARPDQALYERMSREGGRLSRRGDGRRGVARHGVQRLGRCAGGRGR
jgi:MoaA/NifB/PqqE/SkfB family radical SAM enzyme